MALKDKNILIVGLGLIGGSYARALKKKGYTVNAITRSQSTIDYANENGIIDYGTITVEPELIKKSDLIVFSLYPGAFVKWIEENQQYFQSGTIITDVTGVKGCIIDKIQGILRPDVEFIAAHPMAGREMYGVQNSDDSVFLKANYIVVPTKNNSEKAIGICKDLGKELGFANITELDADSHDSMIAFLSQLTHCIAVSLMCSNDNDNLKDYTGDSFRDLTRIASINDDMWSELFLLNKEKLLEQMDAFKNSFDKMYNHLKNDDREGLRVMMKCSTERRKKFNR